MWHFASNIYSILEFAKALPSHLSLVPQLTPALPQKVRVCSLPQKPNQMALVSQLRVLLLIREWAGNVARASSVSILHP